MEAKFYKMTKRLNSTKQPVGTGSITMDVKLKDKTDLVSPSLVVSYSDAVLECNYVEFMSKYYYIDGWSSDRNNIWTASCSLDILSTYKSNILNTTCFVEYDTTENIELVDQRLYHLTTASISSNSAIFTPAFSSAGSFMITVTGRGGSVSTYKVSAAALQSLLNSVQNWASDLFAEAETTAQSVIAMGKQLVSVGSAASNIRSCTWVPWADVGPTASEEIYLGNFSTGVSGGKVTSNVTSHIADIAIPWQYEDWRNSNSNTGVGLFLPYVGNISIDANAIKGQSAIRVAYGVDNRTGAIAYTVMTTDETQVFGSYGGSAGASIPVGVSNISPMSILNAVTTSFAALTGAAPFVGGLAAAAQNAMVPQVTCVGGISSAAGSGALCEFIICFTNCHNTNAEPASIADTMGTPTMQVKSLSGLTGYVKTRGASVSAPTGSQILSEIDRYLDGGVFIE